MFTLFWRRGDVRRKGASAVEFGTLVGLVAIVAIAATSTVGTKVREIFGGTSNAIDSGMAGTLNSSTINLEGGVAGSGSGSSGGSATPSLALTTPSNQSGTQGQSASWNFSGLASGGTAPYTYTLSGCTVASYASGGAASGLYTVPVPMALPAGSETCTLTVYDSAAASQSANFNVAVAAEAGPTLAAIPTQTAAQGQAAAWTLSSYVSGGATPYLGSNVSGCALATAYGSGGLLPGGASESFGFTVGSSFPTSGETCTLTVIDANSVSKSTTFAVAVSALAPPTIAAIPTQTVTDGQAATWNLSSYVSGGATPYTGSYISNCTLATAYGTMNQIPGGASESFNFTVGSAFPTTAETCTLTVVDANSNTSTQTFPVTVNAASGGLSIGTIPAQTITAGNTTSWNFWSYVSGGNWTVGSPTVPPMKITYSGALNTSCPNGTSPEMCNNSGSLSFGYGSPQPVGVPAGWYSSVMSGTPGTFTVTVLVTDFSGTTATTTFNLTIN